MMPQYALMMFMMLLLNVNYDYQVWVMTSNLGFNFDLIRSARSIHQPCSGTNFWGNNAPDLPLLQLVSFLIFVSFIFFSFWLSWMNHRIVVTKQHLHKDINYKVFFALQSTPRTVYRWKKYYSSKQTLRIFFVHFHPWRCNSPRIYDKNKQKKS